MKLKQLQEAKYQYTSTPIVDEMYKEMDKLIADPDYNKYGGVAVRFDQDPAVVVKDLISEIGQPSHVTRDGQIRPDDPWRKREYYWYKVPYKNRVFTVFVYDQIGAGPPHSFSVSRRDAD